MEMIYIVNDHDEVVGVKDRALITPTDTYRISALWLRDTAGNILLAQRSLVKKTNPGQWGPAVVGTVAEGESYESNVIKESAEEIGLTVASPSLGPKWRLTEPTFDLFAQWFTFTVDAGYNEFLVQKSEVQGVKWHSPREITDAIQKDPSQFVPAVAWALKNL